jgi:2-keto-3-deoxy-L-rhamnonate aldolase RhmA
VPNGRSASLMLGIASPDIAALAIQAGCTSVILDCEHGFPLDSTVREMLTATKAHGGTCLVRLPRDRMVLAPAIADIGIGGIVLAGTRGVDDMTTLVRSLSFPPQGVRSMNPFVPAAGTPGDAEHLTVSAGSIQIWTMAESVAFLNDLSSLTSPSEVTGPWSGIIIGPYDLAADLGCAPDADDPILLDAVLGFIKLARANNLLWSMFVRDPSSLERWRERGVDPGSVVIGYDRDVWFRECRDRVSAVLNPPGTPSIGSEIS